MSICPVPVGPTANARTAAALKEAMATNQAVLSLAHNMAQQNGMTAAMIDVITEYVKNKTITPEQAAYASPRPYEAHVEGRRLDRHRAGRRFAWCVGCRNN